MKYKQVLIVLVFLLVFSLSCTSVYAKRIDLADQGKKIIIDIPSRTLTLLQNNQTIKEYPVAVGKSYSQTPTGDYQVMNKVVNPYYSKLNIAGGSPLNPLGSRWIGFKPHYGIHGNSDPNSIGTYASAGCVRMYERDIQEVYEQIEYNIPVIVQYEPIKSVQDIDGRNPIIVVYPDTYRKVQNFNNQIDEKLRLLEFYDKINGERLAELKSLATKEKTIFTDEWAFLVNDQYVSKEVVSEGESVYISKSSLEKFFNIEIYSIEQENKLSFLGNKVESKVINDKNYILIDDIITVVGGTYQINQIQKTVKLDLNYVLLNGKLVKGEAIDLSSDAKISFDTLLNGLDTNASISKGSLVFSHNGENLKYANYDGKPYSKIKDLESLGISANIFTKSKHIELFTDPLVIYNNKIYTGKLLNNNVYLSYGILKDLGMRADLMDPHKPVFNIDELGIKEIDAGKYVDIQEINKYFFINSNYYNTKIYVGERII